MDNSYLKLLLRLGTAIEALQQKPFVVFVDDGVVSRGLDARNFIKALNFTESEMQLPKMNVLKITSQ